MNNSERTLKNENINRTLKNARWLIGVGILLCIIFPFISTQAAQWESLDFSKTGQIGDTIGGITAPVVNLLGAILVFYALKAQIDANRLIQDQFDEQKIDEKHRKKLLYITNQVNIIRTELNEFTFTFRKNNYKYNYTGSDGIYEFLYTIRRGEHGIEYQEFLNRHPKINEFVNLLRIINRQIDIIIKEDIAHIDKEYFISIIEYQYNSKIQQSVRTFREFKRSDQDICISCNGKHGIPDEIFNLCDQIVEKLEKAKTA